MINMENAIIGKNYLPVNSIAAMGRIIELLKELGTNCLSTEIARKDHRIMALMYFLNTQFYVCEDSNTCGTTIDLVQEAMKIEQLALENEILASIQK